MRIPAAKSNNEQKASYLGKTPSSEVKKAIRGKIKKLSGSEKNTFYSSVGQLLNSGIDILTAVEIVMREFKGKRSQQFEGICYSLKIGIPFSQALEKSNLFSRYEEVSVNIGEESGNLGKVLMDLGSFFAAQVERRKKLVSALSYPILVVIISIGTMIFMLEVMIPMFASIFQKNGSQLPWLTLKFIQLSDFIGDYGIFIALLIIGLWVLFKFTTSSFQKAYITYSISTVLPFTKRLYKYIELIKYCRAYSLMLGSGVTIYKASEILLGVVSHHALRIETEKILVSLNQGRNFGDIIKESRVFPVRFQVMIGIGDRVSKLDEMFALLSTEYEKSVDRTFSSLNSLLEPLIIIFLAIIVGVMLVAMYLPIFEMGQSLFE